METRSSVLAIISMLILWMTTGTVAFGYDVAPRISDREIIESLTEIKQGHQTLNQRISDLNQKMDQRLNDLNQKMDQRFTDLHNVVMTMFASVMALIIVLIGYMIWDRKTAQQPLKQRVTSVEETLDVNNLSGPNVNRLIIALQKRAETDETLAGALRNCSLM